MQTLVRAFGILLMLTALVVTLTHAPDRTVDSLVTRWAPPPSDFMYVKGQFVHFRDEGPRDDPAPLVLLHGTAASLHTWQGWVGDLRGRKRVITFDLPGFGLTGPFGGEYPRDDYRADTLARFTLDLLAALHVQRCVLAGNGFGGEVAWRVAAAAPARVERLILVDATGYDIAPERVPLALRMARLAAPAFVGRFLTPRPLVEDALKTAYGDPARVTDLLVDRHLEMLQREGNRRALALRLRAAPVDLAPARIATLHLPTLILWGTLDRLTPLAAAQRFQHDIAGSRLVVLPGLGHLPQEEDAAQSLAPVRAFLGLDDSATHPVSATTAASEPA